DKATGTVVSRFAPAVADVGAPVHAGPGVDRSGRRRWRVSRPRVHVRSLRGSRRQHNESGRSKEEFFHHESPVRCSVRQAAALTFPRQQLEPLTPTLGKRLRVSFFSLTAGNKLCPIRHKSRQKRLSEAPG